MKDITTLLPHLKLRFNLAHPSYEECYVFGYECALANMMEEDNPFCYGTRTCEQWLEGWWDGFYGKKPLFELQTEPMEEPAANDQAFLDRNNRLLIRLLEFSGVIAVSAIIGYQLIELVA